MNRVQIIRTNAGHHGRILGGNGEPLWWTEPYTTERDAYAAIVLLGEVFLGEHGVPSIPAPGHVTFALDNQLLGAKLVVPVEEVDERGNGQKVLPAIPRPDRTPGPDVP